MISWSKGTRASRSAIHARCAKGHTPEFHSRTESTPESTLSSGSSAAGRMAPRRVRPRAHEKRKRDAARSRVRDGDAATAGHVPLPRSLAPDAAAGGAGCCSGIRVGGGDDGGYGAGYVAQPARRPAAGV